MNGGPGSSSQLGNFLELGPYTLVNGTEAVRNGSWNENYNILVIKRYAHLELYNQNFFQKDILLYNQNLLFILIAILFNNFCLYLFIFIAILFNIFCLH
jgi:hypothetical protein